MPERKPRIARYNIDARAKAFGFYHRDLIKLLEDRGIKCTDAQFTKYVYGQKMTPNADKVCEALDDILTGLELNRFKKNY